MVYANVSAVTSQSCELKGVQVDVRRTSEGGLVVEEVLGAGLQAEAHALHVLHVALVALHTELEFGIGDNGIFDLEGIRKFRYGVGNKSHLSHPPWCKATVVSRPFRVGLILPWQLLLWQQQLAAAAAFLAAASAIAFCAAAALATLFASFCLAAARRASRRALLRAFALAQAPQAMSLFLR